MKISIGPFIDGIHLNWHKNYMSAKHGVCWDIPDIETGKVHVQTRFEKTLEMVDDGLQWVLDRTINPILYRRKRKVKIKIHPYDTWSTEHTLALIVLPLIKQLRATKQGAPWVPDEDVPADLGIRSTDCVKKNDYDWDENCHKRWDWILNEIEWTFEQLVDPNSDRKFWVHHEKEYDVSNINNWKRPDFDKEGYEKHEARIQRGLMLFGKNFRNLGD